MKPIKTKPIKPVLSPSLRTLLSTSKKESRLLGEVQRLLLDPQHNAERPVDVLHPSEISHDDWCHRASYYQLKGLKPQAQATPSWQMEMIFQEGHEIHHKWQNWLWDLERLAGVFYCLACHTSYWEESPSVCPNCGASRSLLVYNEVPLVHDQLRIGGHSDGQDIDGSNIEIKSIGLGTLRFEAPDLLKEHTYKFRVGGGEKEFIDLDGLWNGIRRPLPTHMRQGHLYSYVSQFFVDGLHKTNGDEIYIYECKWNQKVKEFVVKFDIARIQGVLDRVKEVHSCLSVSKPPKCIFGGCSHCESYEGEKNGTVNRGVPSRVAGSYKPGGVRRIQKRV